MNDLFKTMNIRKIDSGTGKELDEGSWRKAQGEEKAAFIGYYLSKGIKNTGHIAVRIVFILAFFISLAEFGFGMLIKKNSTFNQIPVIVCMVASIVLLLLAEVIYKMNIKKHILEVKDNIFVTNALAYFAGTDEVQVMINDKRLAYDKYKFTETISPMDYVYDDENHLKGFHVLLYVVIKDGVVQKNVLGNSSYNYYLDRYKNIEKHDDFLVSANI